MGLSGEDSHIEIVDTNKLKRQRLTNAIREDLIGCELMSGLLIKEIGEIAGRSIHPVDKKIFQYIRRLADSSALLIGVGWLYEHRAQFDEKRLEQLEQELEEFKKRIPVDDGK